MRSIKRVISDTYWQFYRRFFDRYDLIKADTLDKRGYYDIDERLLHCIMQTIVDFYDIEVSEFEKQELKNFRNKKPHELDQGSLTKLIEVKAIYNWWKKYPDKLKKIDKLYSDNAPWHCINKFENDLFKEEQDMLIRVIKIRAYLWS